jgi:putative transcriptional regulator
MTAADVIALRERTGLTQEGLARRLGVSVSAVHNWEQGRRKPSGPIVAMLYVLKREVKR